MHGASDRKFCCNYQNLQLRLTVGGRQSSLHIPRDSQGKTTHPPVRAAATQYSFGLGGGVFFSPTHCRRPSAFRASAAPQRIPKKLLLIWTGNCSASEYYGRQPATALLSQPAPSAARLYRLAACGLLSAKQCSECDPDTGEIHLHSPFTLRYQLLIIVQISRTIKHCNEANVPHSCGKEDLPSSSAFLMPDVLSQSLYSSSPP